MVHTPQRPKVVDVYRDIVCGCAFVAWSLLADNLASLLSYICDYSVRTQGDTVFYTDPKDNFKVLAVLIVAYTLFVGVAYYLQTG